VFEKTTEIKVLPHSSSAYYSLSSSCTYNKQEFKSKENQKRVTFSLLKDLKWIFFICMNCRLETKHALNYILLWNSIYETLTTISVAENNEFNEGGQSQLLN